VISYILILLLTERVNIELVIQCRFQLYYWLQYRSFIWIKGSKHSIDGIALYSSFINGRLIMMVTECTAKGLHCFVTHCCQFQLN
jgi:hypothetical protein